MWWADLSRLSHKLARGHDEAWCSYAYRHRHYRVWRLFVRVLGEAHCERSYKRYHRE